MVLCAFINQHFYILRLWNQKYKFNLLATVNYSEASKSDIEISYKKLQASMFTLKYELF